MKTKTAILKDGKGNEIAKIKVRSRRVVVVGSVREVHCLMDALWRSAIYEMRRIVSGADVTPRGITISNYAYDQKTRKFKRLP